MATFDQLTDEQRAIVELVLQQGKSYDELADMLGIPEERVRERAREALAQLAPVSVRGVNLMHVRDGKIVEALGYAKTPGPQAA